MIRSVINQNATNRMAHAFGTRRMSSLSRYGLGGHSWKKFDPSSYSELIHTALSKNVSLLEVSGQEGGDIAMAGAIQAALERSPGILKSKVTITTRLGYRGVGKEASRLSGDVLASEEKSEDLDLETEAEPESVLHNVSKGYLLEAMKKSPLMELRDHVNLVFLIQNPEVQVTKLLQDDPKASLEDRLEYIHQRWTPALEAMQEYTSSASDLSFGVVSNGLGIPAKQKHPMHLSADLVIDAAKTYDKFSTVQLPVNLLETHGWEMARKIHSAVPAVDVMAIRPLTCYPDLGTGDGHPFRLVDYDLPSLHENPLGPVALSTPDGDKDVQFTNEMTAAPKIYQIALQTAMSHFDAEELLEAKQERELTTDERETLDGCKLVQSMIHDLDSDLEKIRSFAAHEEDLYSRIIPLLYDTFEAMDERTNEVLSAYFAAYAVAVRYSIAKKTREVLKEGEDGSTVTYPDIPQSMTLHEYALRQLLADKALSRIIVGTSTVKGLLHHIELMESIDDSPLEAIEKANEAEAKEKEAREAEAKEAEAKEAEAKEEEAKEAEAKEEEAKEKKGN
eukprot:scaffold1966_cov109-Cylindrotheca_fusiformis.AAC.1